MAPPRFSVFKRHPTKVNIICPVALPPQDLNHGAPVEMRCGVEGCTWTAVGTRTVAQGHAKRKHQGSGYHLYRPVDEKVVEEQRKERIRELDRERKRKRYHQVRQAQEHVATAAVAAQGLLALAPDVTPEGQCYFPVDTLQGGGGRVEEVRSWVEAEGSGDCEITGSLSGCSRGAVRVAITWATAHLKVLSQWLPSAALVRGKGEPLHHGLLWRAKERLVVRVESMDGVTGGGSLTVASALSLLCLALRCRGDESVVVTGGMDLRGNILDVEGLAGKLQACMDKGVRKLLVPASSLRHFDQATLPTEELRQYAQEALQEYSSIGEAIQAVLLGCPSLAGVGFSEALGRASRSAVGVCCGLKYARQVSGPPPVSAMTVEVASLHRRGRALGKGTGRLEVTGGATAEGLVEFVKAARSWVCANKASIGACLGLRAGAPDWDWAWGVEDLHVHITRGHESAGRCGCMYTAAIAVAMVSYFTLRRTRPGTVVSGHLNSAQETSWTCGAIAVADMPQVDLAIEQRVKRMVVRDERALGVGMLEALRIKGVDVLVGEGDSPSLVTMLPRILEG